MSKDTFYAKAALILSFGFWIPLFNLGLSLVSIYLALKALKLIDTYPKKYGGRKAAIFAMVLDVTAIILTIVGTVIYAVRKMALPL